MSCLRGHFLIVFGYIEAKSLPLSILHESLTSSILKDSVVIWTSGLVFVPYCFGLVPGKVWFGALYHL